MHVNMRKKLEKNESLARGKMIYEYKYNYPVGYRWHFQIFEKGIEALFVNYNSKLKEEKDPTRYIGKKFHFERYRFLTFDQVTSIHPIMVKLLREINSLRFVVDKGNGKYWLSDTVFGKEEIHNVLPVLERCYGNRWNEIYKEDQPIFW